MEKIIREKALEHKKKKPGLSANRPLNNWVQDEERQSGAKFLVQPVNCLVTAPMKIC